MTTEKSTPCGAAGLAIIKRFEGCRLKAYKPVSTEKYWTIGWGHYGPDVKQGQTITQATADALLVEDSQKFADYVDNPAYCPLTKQLNANQRDALISFTYNCGAGCLKTLCKNRSLQQIAAALPLYNKSGGKALAGLTRRRKAEKELFETPVQPLADAGKEKQSMNFVPRLTRPEAGNKYYITKAAGGYSDAIKGSPTDAACDVLANCVGYAYGRFNEIVGAGCCKYLRPVNAEKFLQYAGGLEVGQEPRLGACAVWQAGATLQGGDGAGHVAIVERIISATEIVTSESGWGSSKPFSTKTRKKGSGNWGAGSKYKFLGFIYNPAPCCAGTASGAATAAAGTAQKTATEAAKSFDRTLAGTYAVNADRGLHIRSGAGDKKASLAVLPKGMKVRNYGYYTLTGGVKWLYVQATHNGVTYTGFMSGQYLRKQ